MDQERVPNDSAREPRRDDRELKRAADLDNEFQPDPQLTEGPAGKGRIASYAGVIALILAAVIYGLNMANHQTSNRPPPQTTQSKTSPSQAAGNDANSDSRSGTTTGSATNRPTPPQSGH